MVQRDPCGAWIAVLPAGDAGSWGRVRCDRRGPLVAAATAQATVRHSRLVAAVQRRLADTTYQRLGDIGTVDLLCVLPLVDRGVQRPGLRGEPGVSYLVRAGREVLLFDTGLNLFGRSRSALVDNAEALGVDLAPGAGGGVVAPA
jgi:7,8-dihydropterin-6-yl-methyl-4-(beta-D-ribofuranosyl)aminobenzene 5'-phosphate synthase